MDKMQKSVWGDIHLTWELREQSAYYYIVYRLPKKLFIWKCGRRFVGNIPTGNASLQKQTERFSITMHKTTRQYSKDPIIVVLMPQATEQDLLQNVMGTANSACRSIWR